MTNHISCLANFLHGAMLARSLATFVYLSLELGIARIAFVETPCWASARVVRKIRVRVRHYRLPAPVLEEWKLQPK